MRIQKWDIMLHEEGKCVGVRGPDGVLYTHNFSLPPEQQRRFRPIVEANVPGHLRGYLAAARRRMEEQCSSA